MATSVRQSYRHPPSVSTGKQPSVRSYPLPLSGGVRLGNAERSLHPTVAPGPVPGQALPSSSSSRRQALPPPVQSRGQYAEHFPSLPGTDNPPVIMTRDPTPPPSGPPAIKDRSPTEAQQRQRPSVRRQRRGDNQGRQSPPPPSPQRFSAPSDKPGRPPHYPSEAASPPRLMDHSSAGWPQHQSQFVYPVHRHYNQLPEGQPYAMPEHPYPDHQDIYYSHPFQLEPPTQPPRLPAQPAPQPMSQELPSERLSQQAETQGKDPADTVSNNRRPSQSAGPASHLPVHPPSFHQLPHPFLHPRYGPPSVPNVPMYPSEAAYFEYLHAQGLHPGGPAGMSSAYVMMSRSPPGIVPALSAESVPNTNQPARRLLPSHLLHPQRALQYSPVLAYHSVSTPSGNGSAGVPTRPNPSQRLNPPQRPNLPQRPVAQLLRRPDSVPAESSSIGTAAPVPGLTESCDASPNSSAAPTEGHPLPEPESIGFGTPASPSTIPACPAVSDTTSSSNSAIRVKVLIPGGKAGVIIGRQGQVINGLRQRSGCRITVSEDVACPDRVLVVTGNSGQVAEVLRRVCVLFSGGSGGSGQGVSVGDGRNGMKAEGITEEHCGLEDERSVDASAGRPRSEAKASGQRNGGLRGRSTGGKGDKARDLMITLAVPSPMCGCLIGRSGAQIKTFRQDFGVSFSVSSHAILDTLERPVDGSVLEETDRPVDVSGPPQRVADCLAEVCRLLATSPVPTSNGGRRGGRGGQGGSCLPNGTVERPHGEDAENSGRFGGAFFSNWRRNVGDAEVHHHGGSEAGEGGVEGERNMEMKQRVGAVLLGKEGSATPREADPVGSSEMLGSAIEECSFELTTGEIEVYLLVPNDIVGCIIGRKGKTISEIRETSGAFIAITESAFPPPIPVNAVGSSLPPAPRRAQREAGGRGARSRDRVICIRGRSRNVRNARYLMGSSILNAQRGAASTESGGTPGASRPA